MKRTTHFLRSLLALILALMLPFNAMAGTFTLPAAIKHVGDQAFMNTDVDKVILPEGTLSIGSQAFANCDNLSCVVIPASVEYIAEDAFEDVLDVEYVVVQAPTGSYAYNWAKEHGMLVDDPSVLEVNFVQYSPTLYLEGELEQVFVADAETVVSLNEGETIEWSVEKVSGDDHFTMSVGWGDKYPEYASVYVENITAAGQATWLVKAVTSGGQTWSQEITTTVTNLPENYPTEIIGADSMTGKVGERIEVNTDELMVTNGVRPEDGNQWRTNIGMLDLWDDETVEHTDTGFSFVPSEARTYQINLRVLSGNVTLSKPFYIIVEEEAGPLTFFQHFKTLYLEGNQSEIGIAGFNYAEELGEGESIVCTVEKLSGDDGVELVVDDSANAYLGNIIARNITAAGQSTWRATAVHSNGTTLTEDFTVTVTNMPENYPTAIIEPVFYGKVGEVFALDFNDFVFNGEFPEDGNTCLSGVGLVDLWGNETLEMAEGGFTFTPDRAGGWNFNYRYWTANHLIAASVKIMVEGDVSADLNMYFPTLYLEGNVPEMEVAELAVNCDLAEGETIDFAAEMVYGDDCVDLYLDPYSEDNHIAYAVATNIRATGSSTWRLTATLPDGTVWSDNITVTVANMPEDYPSEIYVDYPLVAPLNERFEFKPSERVTWNGNLPDDGNIQITSIAYYSEIWEHPTHEMIDDGYNGAFAFTPDQSDRYGISVYTYLSNHVLEHHGIIVAGDGTSTNPEKLDKNLASTVYVTDEDEWVGNVMLNRFHLLPGEQVEWNVELLESENERPAANFYFDNTFENTQGADFRVNDFTGETGTDVWRITARVGESVFTYDHALTVENAPDTLPTGVTVPQTVYEVQVGDTLTLLYEDVQYADGEVPEGAREETVFWSTLVIEEQQEVSWVEEGMSIHFVQEGRYEIHAVKLIGNLALRETVTIIVGDGVPDDSELEMRNVNPVQYSFVQDSSWLGDCVVANYQLCDSEQIEWNVELVEGDETLAVLFLDPIFHEDMLAGMRLKDFSGETGAMTWRVTATSSFGHSWSKEITFEIVETPENLPTGITMPEQYIHLDVGDTYTASIEDIAFIGGEVPENAVIYKEFWPEPYLHDHPDSPDFEWTDDGFRVTFDHENSYYFTAVAYLNGIEYTQTVYITVGDGLADEIYFDWFQKINKVYLNTENSNDHIARFWVVNYDLPEGSEIYWSLEHLEGPELMDLYIESQYDDDHEVWLHCGGLTGETGVAKYRIFAGTDGYWRTFVEFEIEVCEAPEGLPVEITVPQTEYHFNVGDTWEFRNDQIVIGEGSIPEDAQVLKEYWGLAEISESEMINESGHPEGDGWRVTFTEEGRYRFHAVARIESYQIVVPGIIIVGDDPVANAWLETHQPLTTAYTGENDTVFAFSATVRDYMILEGENYYWNLEKISEDEAPMDVWINVDNGEEVAICAGDFNGETGSATYRLTVTSEGGLELSTEFTINVVENPGNLPTGITIPQNDFFVNVGDTLEFCYDDIQIVDGEIPEGADYVAEYWDLDAIPGHEWYDNGIRITFEHEGRYIGHAALKIGNRCLTQPITITVGDGLKDEAEFVYHQKINKVYLGADGHFSDHAGWFDIWNYELAEGEAYEWNIEQIGGDGILNLHLEQANDEGNSVWAYIDWLSGQTGEAWYRITVSTNHGLHYSHDFRLEVLELPEGLPTEVIVPQTEFFFEVGDTHEFRITDIALGEGAVPEDAYIIREYWGLDMIPGCEQILETDLPDGDGWEITFETEGRYQCYAAVKIDSYTIATPFTVIVGDGINEEELVLDIYQPLKTAFAGIKNVETFAVSAQVFGYNLLEGESYDWKLEQISEGEAPAYVYINNEFDNWRGVNLHAMDYADVPGSATYRLSVTSEGGLDLSAEFTIDVIELADNLPTAIAMPQTEFHLESGEWYYFNWNDVTFVDGEVPEGIEVISEIWDIEPIEERGNVEWLDEEGNFRVSFEEEGVYRFKVVKKIGNYELMIPVTIDVGAAMENFIFIDWNIDPIFNNFGEGQDTFVTAFLTQYFTSGHDELIHAPIDWKLEILNDDGNLPAELYLNDNNGDERSWVDVHARNFTGGTGTIEYRVTATLENGESYSYETSVDVIDFPEGLPTEVFVEEESIYLNVGDTYMFRYDSVTLGEGYVPEGVVCHPEAWVDEQLHDLPTFEWLEEGFQVTFEENGRYSFEAAYRIGTYCISKQIRLYVGTGVSDEAAVDWQQEVHTIYTDLDEFSTWIGWGVLYNYNVLKENDVSWTFERIDENPDTPVELYIELYDDNTHADVRYTNITGTGSVTYRLTVEADGGFTDSRDFTVNVEQLPDNMPTDIDVQTYHELNIGDTFVFDASAVNYVDGVVPENASLRYHVNGGDFDTLRYWDSFEWLDTGFQVTFYDEGVYTFGFGMQIGNYTIRKDIYIVVGSGIAADTRLRSWREFDTHYINDQNHWVADLYLENYALLPEENISWSLDYLDEASAALANLYLEFWGDNRSAAVRMNDFTGTAGTIHFRVSVKTDRGFEASEDFSIELCEMPDDLPTDISVPAEDVQLEVGDTYSIRLSEVDFVDGTIPEDAHIFKHFLNHYELSEMEGYRDVDDGFDVTFTHDGRYSFYAVISLNGIEYAKEIRITVGSGMNEAVYLDVWHDMDPIYVGGDHCWLGGAYVQNYNLFEGEAIEWSIENKNASDTAVVDLSVAEESYWDQTRGVNYQVSRLDSAGEETFVISATLPTGQTLENEITVHVQEMPDNLPTELSVALDSHVFNIGDTLTLRHGDIQFANGEVPEDAFVSTHISCDGQLENLPTFEWINHENDDEQGFTVLFTEAASYTITLCKRVGNYSLNQDVTIEVVDPENWKIAILTGSTAQGEEEYTAAQMVVEQYGEEHVITDTYADNFTSDIQGTIDKVVGFAEDPNVRAIIVAQSVPGTYQAFSEVREVRDDVLLISGIPQEDISMMKSVADLVVLSDEGKQAGPIMQKCEEWGIDVFVHYSFPRHLAYEEVAERRDLLAARAAELGMTFVEVTIPDPTADGGVEASRSYVTENVASQMEAYAGQKVAFFSTACGVQSALQAAVLEYGNAYYPSPCCPSPFHGFGGALGLEFDLTNPADALRQTANALNDQLATGRFSTAAVPVNMGIILTAADYAVAYACGEADKNDTERLNELFADTFGAAKVSNDEYGNVYTILPDLIDYLDYVTNAANVVQLWVAEGVREFTQAKVDSFMAEHDYENVTINIHSVGEGAAANMLIENVETGADVYGFAQDQLARLVATGAISELSAENAAIMEAQNDAGAVNASKLEGTAYAYPMTSDNGYFLYYDKSVVTDPSSLEAVLAACEAAGKNFFMEITSGWYQPAFFFGAGCTLTYDVDEHGNMVACNVDYASENGLRAFKAMINMASSESFSNFSEVGNNLGALVSGMWNANLVEEALGSNYAAVKLPTADGFQLSGFGGYKLMGVKPQQDATKQALCEELAMYLTSEEVQAERYDAVQWGPSNLNVQQSDAVQSNIALAALADQLQYCVPQGQYPAEYWSLAEEFGKNLIEGRYNDMTDEELMQVLVEYEEAARSFAATMEGGYKIAILTGSTAQGEEEYTAARMVMEQYGEEHVITDTYADNFTSDIQGTMDKIIGFAEDPSVRAIIVAQSVPGTYQAFSEVREMRDDVLLISGIPQEDISMMKSVADLVVLSDEGKQAGPIMQKCEEWGIDVFVHYSFPRHLAYEEVAERRDLLAARAAELGMTFVEVNIPDPTADEGVEFSCAYVAENVATQMSNYAGQKVAFFSTACGVQAALQSAVLAHDTAYYPSPCCPSPLHGFGSALGLVFDLSNPADAFRQTANALGKQGAAGRFSTAAVPVNMGIILSAADYAMAYACGEVEKNDSAVLGDLFGATFGNAEVSNDEYDNVYTILPELVSFERYAATGSKIAILTGSEANSQEEYTAAQMALEAIGTERVIVDIYSDNFMDDIEGTTNKLLAFAEDPDVGAIIVMQSVPGTLDAFEQIRESRPDMLLISGLPHEDIGAMASAADLVMLSDEARQAEPIMQKCEEWGIEVFVHYSFPRHMALSEVIARRDLLAEKAAELGIEFVEVEIPDPVADTGLAYSRSQLASDVGTQMNTYADKKVAFFCTNCGVQSALQEAVLNYANAYYPSPCCPSPFHGFGESLGLELDLRNPAGALSAVAGALKEHGAAGRFATAAVPMNMAIIDVAGEYAAKYLDGAITSANDSSLVNDLFIGRFGACDLSNDPIKNVYSIVPTLVCFENYAVEPIKLRWAMGTGTGAPADNEMVLEELNQMSRELIGVECEIEYLTEPELQMAVAAGEEYDIYFTCDWFFNTNRATADGLFLDIADVVETVTPDMYASMNERVWELAKTADGGLYAIPCKKDYAAMHFISYPTEKAAALGFDIPGEISAWSELTPFLEAWKATLPEGEYPVLIGGAARGVESSFDFIDRTALIGCRFGTSEVVTVFDDPEIMERYRTLADWYSKGIINPDAPNITESSIDTSKLRIDMVQAWPAYDYSPSNGYDTSMTLYAGPNMSVAGVQGAMNALSSRLANDPERRDAALKYLELCHTNQLFIDTMRYGVQGYHWNYVTAEESAECAGAVLRTAAGSSNYTPWGFSQPAYFESSISVSADQVAGIVKAPALDQYDLYYEAIEQSCKASALGSFKMDTSRWTDALAEITAVKDEYFSDFATGARSIDDVYDEFIAKMNAAGLQEMIADAQSQLDAYLGK